jgi:hypothetical protein
VATERLRALARTVRYGTEGPSMSVAGVAAPTSAVSVRADRGGVLTAVSRHGLRPWRDVARPHPDVSTGRYRQAEFAADLG